MLVGLWFTEIRATWRKRVFRCSLFPHPPYKSMYDRHLVANRRNNAGTFCFDSVFTDLGFHLGKEATHTVLTTRIGTPSILYLL